MIVLSSAAGLLSGFVVRSHNCHRSVISVSASLATLAFTSARCPARIWPALGQSGIGTTSFN